MQEAGSGAAGRGAGRPQLGGSSQKPGGSWQPAAVHPPLLLTSLCQQHVELAGHAARHRVDAKPADRPGDTGCVRGCVGEACASE